MLASISRSENGGDAAAMMDLSLSQTEILIYGFCNVNEEFVATVDLPHQQHRQEWRRNTNPNMWSSDKKATIVRRFPTQRFDKMRTTFRILQKWRMSFAVINDSWLQVSFFWKLANCSDNSIRAGCPPLLSQPKQSVRWLMNEMVRLTVDLWFRFIAQLFRFRSCYRSTEFIDRLG